MNGLVAAFRLNPGAKPHPAVGIRTAIAALVPFLALAAIHRVTLGESAVLGALFASFCDSSSSAQARIKAMGIVTIAGALLLALGRSLGDLWWLAVPANFLATLVAGLVLAYGYPVFMLALLLNIVFAVALGMGGGPSHALTSSLGFLIGGICSTLLALAAVLARSLHDASAISYTPAPVKAERLPLAPSPERLTSRSSVLRYAVPRAMGVALAAAVSWSLGVSHAHWTVVPVIMCVLPDRSKSMATTAQFAAGSLLGAIVAELAIITARDTTILGLLAIALMAVALSVRDLSQALSTFFMTIMVLLLISIPTGGVSLARLRIIESLVGIAIALAAAYLGTDHGQRGERQDVLDTGGVPN